MTEDEKNKMEKSITELIWQRAPLTNKEKKRLDQENKRMLKLLERKGELIDTILSKKKNDEFHCGYCGSEDLDIHNIEKEQTICHSCNSVFLIDDIGAFVA